MYKPFDYNVGPKFIDQIWYPWNYTHLDKMILKDQNQKGINAKKVIGLIILLNYTIVTIYIIELIKNWLN